jgi:outer membrane protein TolC
MARPSIYTPEEISERRREQVRIGVAKYTERMANLSSLEQAAHKARATLGEAFDPYTAEERERLDYINEARAKLEKEVNRLNARMTARYRDAVAGNPSLSAILAELETGKEIRMALKPH